VSPAAGEPSEILIAGVASLVAGAMSMAAGRVNSKPAFEAEKPELAREAAAQLMGKAQVTRLAWQGVLAGAFIAFFAFIGFAQFARCCYASLCCTRESNKQAELVVRSDKGWSNFKLLQA